MKPPRRRRGAPWRGRIRALATSKRAICRPGSTNGHEEARLAAEGSAEVVLAWPGSAPGRAGRLGRVASPAGPEQVEDESGADRARADAAWAGTPAALGTSGATWQDLAGDQHARRGTAPARPR